MELQCELARKVPINGATRSGTLRLADGRLSFTRSRDRVVFDVPMAEVHSVATTKIGFNLWHGATRYRVTFVPSVHQMNTGHDLLDIGIAASGAIQALAEYGNTRQVSQQWVDALAPLAGQPPPGLRVPEPWGWWQYTALIVGITLRIGGVVTGIVLLSV